MSAQSNDDWQSATALSAVVLPKIQEARRIADAARWGLLDVIVWLDEVEDDIRKNCGVALRAALDDLDLFPAEPENHEDYEPGTPYGYRPDDEPNR